MPKIVDHEEKREDILNRCFELFARRGYGAVTMREIARRVGVSTGTLYHYFPAKNELFQQMFRLMSRRDTLRAERELALESDYRARLRRLVRFVSINAEHFQNLLLMALDYHRRHGHEAASRRFIRETLAFYRQVLREQLGLRETGLERVIFSCLIGMLVQQMLDPEADFAGEAGILRQFGLAPLPG